MSASAGKPARFQAIVGKHLFDKIRPEAPKKNFRFLPILVFSLPTLPYVTVAHPAHRSTLVPTYRDPATEIGAWVGKYN